MDDLKEMKRVTNLTTLYISVFIIRGGLSVISYIDINHAGIFKDVKVTTYGAPMVGNIQWAAHVDEITGKKVRRYYIKGDSVVSSPTCKTSLCTYRQTGVGIICNPDQALCEP